MSVDQSARPDDAELKALYRAASQAAQEEPDARLDARILQAAQAAAAERLRHRQRPRAAWWKRWLVPVSVTAVAVLGVSLTLRVNEEQAALKSAPLASPAPAMRQSELPPAPQMNEATADRDPPLADRRHDSGPAPRRAAPASPRPEPVPAAAASGAVPETPALRTMESPAAEKKERAPAAPHPPSVRDEISAPAAERANSAAKASSAPTASEPRPTAERRARVAERDQAMEASRSNASGALNKSVAPALGRSAAESFTDTPEHWLDHIRELRRTGHHSEAASQLARFRQRYPEVVLPADLR